MRSSPSDPFVHDVPGGGSGSNRGSLAYCWCRRATTNAIAQHETSVRDSRARPRGGGACVALETPSVREHPVTVICYPDGRVAEVGDRVLADGIDAVVEAVIDSEARVRALGTGEPGLMLRTARFGRVFEPLPLDVEFVSRGGEA